MIKVISDKGRTKLKRLSGSTAQLLAELSIISITVIEHLEELTGSEGLMDIFIEGLQEMQDELENQDK